MRWSAESWAPGRKGRGQPDRCVMISQGGRSTPGNANPRSAAWQSRLWKPHRRWRLAGWTGGRPEGPKVSILLVTCDRLAMLKQCVSSLLANTRDVEYELIVWDNASTDGTAEYLDSIASLHSQVRVIHHADNIGLNAIPACARLARGDYLLKIDDDVLEVPPQWLTEMIRAFEVVPRAGYLAANVVQDEVTNGAKPPQDNYRTLDYGEGVIVEHGPTGGWCTITSRAVVRRIGGFLEMPGSIFFPEDGDFARRCSRRLYRVGIVRDVRVYHATGVAKNLEHGCLEVCRRKYADDPQYKHLLAATIEAMADSDEAQH